MNKRKRILALFLVFIMIFLTFSSCSDGKDISTEESSETEAGEKPTKNSEKNTAASDNNEEKTELNRLQYESLDKMLEEHSLLVTEIATEGMVLLKNEQEALPLKNGTEIAVFGKGQIELYKGGTGSGEVQCEHVTGLLEGLRVKESEGKLSVYKPLADKYERNANYKPSLTVLSEAATATDSAIYVISRNAGETQDRTATRGDYYLSDDEIALIEDMISAGFKNINVVLNVGGVIDTTELLSYPEIKSILLAWQPGQTGGHSIADILVGDATPSGKLSDTFCKSYSDYPSSDTFNESKDYIRYTEDIFVGYRYFETFDPNYEKVNFEFGFGLSYTAFEISDVTVSVNDDEISVGAKVKNTGNYNGKEVVQVYFSAPQGLLGKAGMELCAFKKTATLAPGEEEFLTMTFDIKDMASYDDLGKIKESAYVLEKGDYNIYVGNSVKNAKQNGTRFTYTIEKNRVTEQLSRRLTPTELDKRLLANGEYESLANLTAAPEANKVLSFPQKELITPDEPITIDDVIKDCSLIDGFLSQMSTEELIRLLYSHKSFSPSFTGSFGNLYEYGVAPAESSDGPAGLRLSVNATAFPVATMLACSWNTEIIRKMGEAVAEESVLLGIDVWLAPGVNIHRDPLCGRNFEYFSEDPFLSGIMASYVIQGIQSKGVSAMIKHFVANEREYNRNNYDSRVSERALREIYLEPFRIAIELSDPWALMTSYNYLNGKQTAESYDLITGILYEEWGYEGVVCSDWYNNSNEVKELLAGQSLKADNGSLNKVLEGCNNGTLSRELLEYHAEKVLRWVLKTNAQNRVAEYAVAIAKDGKSVVYGTDSVWRSEKIGTEYCKDKDVMVNITQTEAGEWIIIPIDVEENGEYEVSVRYASPNGSGGFTLSVDGQEQTAFFNQTKTGDWQKWRTSQNTVSLNLTEGKHELKIDFKGGYINLGYLIFEKK